MDAKRCRHLARVAAAAAAGRRELLRGWYRAALGNGVPVADLQEATLQVFLFAGYPRTIDAFEELEAAYGEPPPPPQEPEPGDLLARGQALFRRIYGRHTPAVLEKLRSLHPDFARYVIYDAYGQVLGRPFLPVQEREVLAVAMLAVLGLKAQLKAHVRGALRVGTEPELVRVGLAAAGEAEPIASELRDVVERTLAGPPES
jgi:4-carboxymuconolactone decarboxylase